MTRLDALFFTPSAITLMALMAVACGQDDGHAAPGVGDASARTDGTQPALADASGAAADASDAASFADAGTVSVARDSGAPLSPFAFGQNYWDWIDWANNGTSGLTGTEALATSLHLGVLRAGGDNNDTNSPQPFDTTQIDKFITYCRAVGAEPILQVPILSAPDGGAATAQTAADMVTYANVTKGYGVKYWEIGNEPDLYSATYAADSGAPLDAGALCNTYMSYVPAMQAANLAAGDAGSPIQIVGPDLSWEYVPGNDWLTPFLDACKDLINVVSVHRYPYSAAMVSTNGAIADAQRFRAAVTAVKAIVQGHANPGTPLAFTETNISYDYDPTKYDTDASAAAAPGTFPAAIWTADVGGIALETNLWTLAFWNLAEPNVSGSVLGYIVAGQPSPSYYAEQMVSQLSGDILAPTGIPYGYSVYASHDPAAGVSMVLLLNKTTDDGSVGVSLDGQNPVPVPCPGMSITLVQIPDDPAGAAHVWRYTGDLAANMQAPLQLQ